MPRISVFHGIAITMHWREGHHQTPHFHAHYGEHEASFDLAGRLIAGRLPRRQLRLVLAWTALHRQELLADWDLVCAKKPLKAIAPLR
jgi:hypothetical protein